MYESFSFIHERGEIRVTERMAVLKKCDELSVAKIFTVFGMIWGICMGFMLALNIGAGASVMGLGGTESLGAGIMGVIMMVVLGAIIFFVIGLVSGFVYNIGADKIGGIEVTLDIVE